MLLSLFVVIAKATMAPWQCAHAYLFYALLLPITVFLFSFFQEAEQGIPPSLSTYSRVCISHFPAVYRLVQGISDYFFIFEKQRKKTSKQLILFEKPNQWPKWEGTSQSRNIQKQHFSFPFWPQSGTTMNRVNTPLFMSKILQKI